MAKRTYLVINDFYFGGELVRRGDEVELTDDEAEYFAPKDVIGNATAGGGRSEDKDKDAAGRGAGNAKAGKDAVKD